MGVLVVLKTLALFLDSIHRTSCSCSAFSSAFTLHPPTPAPVAALRSRFTADAGGWLLPKLIAFMLMPSVRCYVSILSALFLSAFFSATRVKRKE